ncbi:metallophosphoesterase [Priestia flexa]|uniref:metallophosphoesterase n=1 Tax=Priestia flexa TaxID=86664 RepID=UPI000551E710|nr:metallophosphoesterase [Priestia flexa]
MSDTNQLLKLKDESFVDYHVRLFDNKDEYKIDSHRIAELLNSEYGSKYDESKWRKDYAQYCKWKSYFVEKNLDEEITKKHEEIRIESEKERIRKQDQRREYQKLIREQARIEHVRDEMIKELHKINKKKPIKWNKKDNYQSENGREGLLVLSDLHYGLFTNNHWNKFDNDEFINRMSRLVTKTIEHGKNNKVSTLHLFMIGDLINGLIHQVTRIVNTEDAVSQTMSVSEILAEVIGTLSDEFDHVKVYNCRGNHDRVTPNRKDEIAKESFNDLIPWYLKTRLKDSENVEFVENEIDDEIIIADIAGNKVFAAHGHKDKINNIAQNLTMMTKQFPEYIIMGHYHHHEEKEIHDVEVIINSSFSGVDEYAKDIRATSKAAQKFIIFTKEDKRLCTYNILLNK